jgi:AcrR family transcriptional regulator
MAGEAKRKAILSAAQELLLKHGLRGTSMEAIARQARIAKPTLYAYFPDKAAIFKTLVDAVIAQWRDNFVQALQGDGDIVQRVGAALTAKNKGAMRLINASPHAAELYEAHDRVSAAQFRSFDAEVAAALEAALSQAGVVRARLLTQMLLAASFGIGHKATSPAKLGPALRLLAERLIRPELPAA